MPFKESIINVKLVIQYKNYKDMSDGNIIKKLKFKN